MIDSNVILAHMEIKLPLKVSCIVNWWKVNNCCCFNFKLPMKFGMFRDVCSTVAYFCNEPSWPGLQASSRKLQTRQHFIM